ncbi:MAG: hypothetical protein IT521_16820 [Burkholderiales bacterium]|nr:hypothetical protein [Burkholderiales bacterium]
MNTFKHKSLYAAVAGLGALSAAGVAQAVSVNHDGLGQALIYPYYTVRSVPTGVLDINADYNSLLSVVNSTASAKAVKVRFLEGKNSREVLDFNLYLSAKDVWTAAIIPTTDGAGIFTADKSCTTPKVSTDSSNPTKFVNYAYSGSADDKAGTSLDRTREGYVEIIEMGDVIGSTAIAATHVGGVPPCTPAALASPVAPSNTVPGTGGLFGSMTLINVLRGEDFAIDATALDGFSAVARWYEPGDVRPTLADVNPKTSVVVAGPSVFITDWTGSSNAVDPVSAVLMHNNVYNEFVLDASTKSGTDWVVTFPTKREYVFVGSGPASKLFQSNFSAIGSCDEVVVTQYDREERTIISDTSFSPPPPTLTDSLCWEANVISFNGKNVLGSKNVVNIATSFANGWVSLNWFGSTVPAGRHQLVGGSSQVFNTRTGGTIGLLSTTFTGLPLLGFAAITFENESLSIGPSAAIQSNYGGNLSHKVTTDVQ